MGVGHDLVTLVSLSGIERAVLTQAHTGERLRAAGRWLGLAGYHRGES